MVCLVHCCSMFASWGGEQRAEGKAGWVLAGTSSLFHPSSTSAKPLPPPKKSEVKSNHARAVIFHLFSSVWPLVAIVHSLQLKQPELLHSAPVLWLKKKKNAVFVCWGAPRHNASRCAAVKDCCSCCLDPRRWECKRTQLFTLQCLHNKNKLWRTLSRGWSEENKHVKKRKEEKKKRKEKVASSSSMNRLGTRFHRLFRLCAHLKLTWCVPEIWGAYFSFLEALPLVMWWLVQKSGRSSRRLFASDCSPLSKTVRFLFFLTWRRRGERISGSFIMSSA